MEQTSIKQLSKNRCGKRVEKRASVPVNPGTFVSPTNTYKSTRHIRPLKETHMSWERKVQRGECRKTNHSSLTRLGRLRARSGYIGAKGGWGYPAFGHTKLRVVGGPPPEPSPWGPGRGPLAPGGRSLGPALAFGGRAFLVYLLYK